MNDERGLRDALESLVPDPPSTREWGAESRGLARRTRVRRVSAVAVTVVLVALAVPVVRSLGSSDHPHTLQVTTHGTGPAACRQLRGHGLGFQVESRVVPASTADRWDPDVTSSGTGPVTVCVWSKPLATTVVATRRGQAPIVVTSGSYQQAADTMVRLGEQQQREPAGLTTAPFTCPQLTNDNAPLAGTARLPLGATGARICYSIANGPELTLTSGVDDLVRAMNAQPLTYSRASTCGGTPGMHGYTLVLDYSTGTRVVAGDGCGWFGVGPVQRRDTNPAIGDRFLAALAHQEEAAGITQPATCPGPISSPEGHGDLTHVVAARFCTGGASGDGTLLTPAQLAQLQGSGTSGRGTDSYDGSTTAIEGPCTAPSRGWPHLMLSDAWHQQFSVTLRCRHRRFWELRLGVPGQDVVRPVLIGGVEGLLRQLDRP